MDRHFTAKRRLILVGLGVLLVGDVGLAAYNYSSSVAERVPMAKLDEDSRKLNLLAADVERAAKIRQDLPATIADYDRFDASFLPASTGNSAVTAELDGFAKQAGVQIQSVGFRHTELKERPLTQVDLDATVNGDYASIVKFMNSVQRSRSFYIVESLSLAQEGQGGPLGLHISLRMRTYFRTAA